jgi:hypothetical protein
MVLSFIALAAIVSLALLAPISRFDEVMNQ